MKCYGPSALGGEHNPDIKVGDNIYYYQITATLKCSDPDHWEVLADTFPPGQHMTFSITQIYQDQGSEVVVLERDNGWELIYGLPGQYPIRGRTYIPLNEVAQERFGDEDGLAYISFSVYSQDREYAEKQVLDMIERLYDKAVKVAPEQRVWLNNKRQGGQA